MLVALAAQAWWEGREDRERERTYLAQLLADTRENDRRLDEAIAEDSVSLVMTTRIMAALDRPEPVPADSLLSWMGWAGRASDYKAVDGTYQALLGTGDLRLVRNDTLRTLITAYAGTMESERRRLEQLRAALLDVVPELASVLPFMRRVFTGDIDPSGIDMGAIRADPRTSVMVFTLQATTVNRLNGLQRLRDWNHRLRTALEADPALRQDGG